MSILRNITVFLGSYIHHTSYLRKEAPVGSIALEQEVPGLESPRGQGALSVWSLYVLSVFTWVSLGALAPSLSPKTCVWAVYA